MTDDLSLQSVKRIILWMKRKPPASAFAMPSSVGKNRCILGHSSSRCAHGFHIRERSYLRFGISMNWIPGSIRYLFRIHCLDMGTFILQRIREMSVNDLRHTHTDVPG